MKRARHGRAAGARAGARRRFRRSEWDQAVGSSGTIRSVERRHARARRRSTVPSRRKAVEALIEERIKAGDVSQLRLPGLTRSGWRSSRRSRDPDRDPRSRSASERCASPTARCVRDCCTTWSAASPTRMRARAACARCRRVITSTLAQAERVEATVLDVPAADVRRVGARRAVRRAACCRWAARLHEIGLDVSHSHYHKHGAYLLRVRGHAGISAGRAADPRGDRRRAPAQGHVRVDRGADAAVAPQGRVPDRAVAARRAAASRSQSDARCRSIELHAKGRTLEIVFPKGWLDDHPLTATDLEKEIEYLKAPGSGCKVG